jgi:hypothetical protein
MEPISALFDVSRFEPKKSKLSTQWQVDGSRYAKSLGATKPSEYGQVIRFTKLNPGIVARAYQFAIDYPNCKSPLRIFFWKFHQLSHI